MPHFPGMTTGRYSLICGVVALLSCALAMAPARAQQYGPKLPEAQSSGGAKSATPRKTERRSRYAAPVEMERIPAPAVDTARPAPLPPPASSRPTPPSSITSCDPGGCWDSSGQRYNGSGSAMIRGDGRVCQPAGGVMQCN